ncbi:serine/threonine-protein kinase [Sphaerisporangium aureirubrum]|uniref:Serine/threonine-protein kinase n=1 Tax=Sphaerisporangium aureirubrum TaxID=1544736 RepID=A0ABW1NRY2_9ACTN
MEYAIPLRPSFRYVHEPLQVGDGAIPFLGDMALVDELATRVGYSRGGTFLITGFRGIGKTTLVTHALHRIAENTEPDEIVVPVVLSVARPVTPDRLLYTVLRRTYEQLNELGGLRHLPDEARRSLLLAYQRTSVMLKQSNTATSEAGISVSSGEKGVPGAGLTAKRGRTMATEASYLTYSEHDVEYDLTRVVRAFGGQAAPSFRRSRRRLWGGRRAARVRLVVVLDEVDKMTAGPTGLSVVEDLLTSLKTVLTMRGVHFLVVGGPDLYDHALKDVGRGNSVYESVFAWRLYVPCTWDAAKRLLEAVTAERVRGTEELERYLSFKARGVPRRLLQEFNELVTWDDGRPVIRLDAAASDRIGFYAKLERLLDDLHQETGTFLFPIAIDEDRRRLSAYYVIDWILRTNGRTFSVLDILGSTHQSELDPLLGISRRRVDRLLAHLAGHGVIEAVRELGATATIIPDVAAAQVTAYKLVDNVKEMLLGLARHHESERGGRSFAAPPPGPDGFSGTSADNLVADRYILGARIGAGGMGEVFSGFDLHLRRDVAIKVLYSTAAGSPAALTRFRREAEITIRTRHPHLVAGYQFLDDPRVGPALVLELVEGTALDDLVRDGGPLPPAAAVQVGVALAEAVEYLSGQSIMRLDLKPSNVIVSPFRGPVIIDLGVAREEGSDHLTDTGMFIGTPGYLAPETVEGLDDDYKSDVHALGAVLCYALTGRPPFGKGTLEMVFYNITTGKIDLEADISPALRTAVLNAMTRDPALRSTPRELRDALLSTPEATLLPIPWPTHPNEITGEIPGKFSQPSPDDSPTRTAARPLPGIFAPPPPVNVPHLENDHLFLTREVRFPKAPEQPTP